MNILLIGGNGFIGVNLANYLGPRAGVISIMTRSARLMHKDLRAIKLVNADYGDRSALRAALVDIDVVCHLVSQTSPSTSMSNIEADVYDNVLKSIALMDECVHAGVKKIIYVSSGGAIYGQPERLPVNEKAPTDPQSGYGISKLTIEKYLSLYKQQYGLNYIIVRPSNPYGPWQEASQFQGLITTTLLALKDSQTIKIWGDGSSVRDFIYIDDLVQAISLAIFKETEAHVFNIGSGEGVSVTQILDMATKITGRSTAIVFEDFRSFDVKTIYLDIRRARSDLGWTPKIRLDEGIERTWRFMNR